MFFLAKLPKVLVEQCIDTDMSFLIKSAPPVASVLKLISSNILASHRVERERSELVTIGCVQRRALLPLPAAVHKALLLPEDSLVKAT